MGHCRWRKRKCSQDSSPIEKLLTQEWSADYEGHKITVTLQAYRSFVAKLYIDEELRDDNRLEASKVRARGEIWLSTVVAGTMDRVDVRFRADFGGIKAKILLNGRHIGGDIFENSPHSDRVDSSSPEVWRPGLLRKNCEPPFCLCHIERHSWGLVGIDRSVCDVV